MLDLIQGIRFFRVPELSNRIFLALHTKPGDIGQRFAGIVAYKLIIEQDLSLISDNFLIKKLPCHGYSFGMLNNLVRHEISILPYAWRFNNVVFSEPDQRVIILNFQSYLRW